MSNCIRKVTSKIDNFKYVFDANGIVVYANAKIVGIDDGFLFGCRPKLFLIDFFVTIVGFLQFN